MFACRFVNNEQISWSAKTQEPSINAWSDSKRASNKSPHAEQYWKNLIGGSKRGARDARPPLGPNSFIFMQFLGNFWSNIRLAPPPWGWRPFLWESWIRHCVNSWRYCGYITLEAKEVLNFKCHKIPDRMRRHWHCLPCLPSQSIQCESADI